MFVPVNARRFSDLAAACLIDGVYLVRWPWLGAVLPLLVCLLGFWTGWQHPGFSDSISYTYSLPIMALMLIFGAMGASQGSWLGLGYVFGDFLFFDRPTYDNFLSTVIRIYGPLILSYVLLAQLIVFTPLVSQSIRQATLPSIRIGDRKLSLVALPVAAALHAILQGGFTFLWVHTTPTLIRPLYTWPGGQPPVNVIEPLQQHGQVLVILAILLGVGRVLLEDYCQRTDQNHLAEQMAAKVAVAPQNPFQFPHVGVAIVRSLFLAFMLSGILTGVLQGVYLALTLFLIFTIRRYLSALFPLWPRIASKVPILARLLLAGVINFWVANKLVQQYWGTSNTFFPILLSTGVGFIIFSIFFPQPVSDEPAQRRINNTEQLLLIFACTALITGLQQPVIADNCGSLSDCYMVIRNAIIAGGAIAIGVSLGLDLLPVIGDLKGIIEGIRGRDSITGEQLEGWQRVLGAIPIIGRLGDLAKIADVAVDAARVASEAADVAKAAAATGDAARAAEAAATAARAADQAAESARAIGSAGDAAKAGDATRAAEAARDAARATSEASDAARSAGATEAAASAASAAAKNLDKLDNGHSILRHGPEVSSADLKKRLTDGIAPDGKFSPTPASTRFKSYDDWLKTRQAALDSIAKREGIDLTKAPPPGKEGPLRITMDHGQTIDEGFIGVGNKVKIPNPSGGKPGTGYSNVQPVDGLTRTTTTIEWNATSQKWEVKQHFPDARNWNQQTGVYNK
ncbi:hypothetical protein C7B61_00125 [filamentous cyanobacterium CCP1]|nr:hypothetical protein C7B61_00125 [filamentous cyanobacterium CCP1]